MPSPFPGMDPYLEDPYLWPDVHHGLISALQERINSGLRPHYVARLEIRIYLATEDELEKSFVRVPDIRIEAGPRPGRRLPSAKASVAVGEPMVLRTMSEDDQTEEALIKVINSKTGDVITVIEVLSPTNKASGSEGRASYTKKQTEVFRSPTHYIEIDLLRGGKPTFPRGDVSCDYAVHVSRVEHRPDGRVWPIYLRNRLPVVYVPLQGDDPDFPVDLQDVLNTAYDRAAYEVTIDYAKEPVPPLRPEDAAWADKVLRKAKLRPAKRAR